ncbi:MAG: hypothetical protein MJ209_06835 [archaeon]|nr:hypothetical protein [archaeon]
MLLTLLAIILPVLGVTTSLTLGVSAALSSAFGGSSYGSSSNYSDSLLGSNLLGNNILEIFLIVILAIIVLFGGCYLGFYLRENFFR